MVDTVPHKKVRRHQDNLAGEHTLVDAGQLILFVLFVAVWISDAFFLKYSTMLNDYIPLALKLTLGIIILIIGVIMAWNGMCILFGRTRIKPRVIDEGIYGILRHPIYLSEILLYLGLIFINTSLAAIGVLIIAIIFFHYTSRFEEKVLLESFGDDYRKYMQEVPMYFPRIFRGKRRSS
jgi:protein-S-isoprenylcysteine O-methyltransferase Ste14